MEGYVGGSTPGVYATDNKVSAQRVAYENYVRDHEQVPDFTGVVNGGRRG